MRTAMFSPAYGGATAFEDWTVMASGDLGAVCRSQLKYGALSTARARPILLLQLRAVARQLLFPHALLTTSAAQVAMWRYGAHTSRFPAAAAASDTAAAAAAAVARVCR
jgi:hypothetical protein